MGHGLGRKHLAGGKAAEQPPRMGQQKQPRQHAQRQREGAQQALADAVAGRQRHQCGVVPADLLGHGNDHQDRHHRQVQNRQPEADGEQAGQQPAEPARPFEGWGEDGGIVIRHGNFSGSANSFHTEEYNYCNIIISYRRSHFVLLVSLIASNTGGVAV